MRKLKNQREELDEIRQEWENIARRFIAEKHQATNLPILDLAQLTGFDTDFVSDAVQSHGKPKGRPSGTISNEKIREFIDTLPNRPSHPVRSLTYSLLDDSLAANHLCWAKVYRYLSGSELIWPETIADLADELEDLSDRSLSALVEISAKFRELLPEERAKKDELKTPTARALYIIEHSESRAELRQHLYDNIQDKSFRAALDDRSNRTTIPIEFLPRVADFLNVSLWWLLGSGKSPVIALCVEIEKVISNYMFMLPSAQEDFRAIVEKFASGRLYLDDK